MKDYSDEEIIAKIQSPNPRENDQALEYLYRAYFDKIIRFIKRNGGDQTDAEDVFQEALLAFYNQMKKGRVLECSHRFLLIE